MNLMSVFNPDLILALAKVTVFLCIAIALAMLIRRASARAIVLTVTLILTPVVFLCSYTQPLIEVVLWIGSESSVDIVDLPVQADVENFNSLPIPSMYGDYSKD